MNPFKPGDIVVIKRDIKDAYEEVWHKAGDRLEVDRIAPDGEGLMFGSDLGIHYSLATFPGPAMTPGTTPLEGLMRLAANQKG